MSSARAARPAVKVEADSAGAELAFARRLLHAEAAAVSALADSVGPAFREAVGLMVRCADAGGNVLVTGLGKSGVIGQKIAATLTSLGITSHFVHPSEAAHGDLGRFRPSDLCLALSYSGETSEVVDLAGILRQDGLPIIAVTRGPGRDGGESSLERLATVSLSIGHCDDREITPAPTCSTTAMLALGDALAVCAARRRNFTDDDFHKRHPGGSLGGLLRPVVEVLRFTVGKNLTPARDDVTVGEALRMAETGGRRPGALLLIDRGTGVLTGIFTDADLRRLLIEDEQALSRHVSSVMTHKPGTLLDTALVRDAVSMVREFRRDEIPVVDGEGRPIGLLDVQDLIAMKLIQSE